MPQRFHITLFTLIWLLIPSFALAEPFRILWLNASVNESLANSKDRRALASFVDKYDGGETYDVTFLDSRRRGTFASHIQGNRYDLIVVDGTKNSRAFNAGDLEAFRQFYAGSSKALMLDGSFWIRNTRYHKLSVFPGKNRVLAGLLINQIEALRKAGGGFLIGTDHDQYQVSANQVLGAILPGAKFSRSTNPSTDGEFIGNLLVASSVAIKPADVLRHWASIPNQGQAPTGQFKDFSGAPVTLHSLVEISDKPGGKRRRTYVSFTQPSEGKRYAVDSETAPEAVEDNMPTRKSP